MENLCYEAKDYAKEQGDKSKEAIDLFKQVLDIEKDQKSKSEHGFKALKWLSKLYHRTKQPALVKQSYLKLLNEYGDILAEKEKAMTKLLESLEDYKDIADLFDETLKRLEKQGNKKAALRLELSQAKILLKNKDWDRLSKSLENMYSACRLPDGTDDHSKGNQLLEIYAMSIHMEDVKQNNKKLKELYTRALNINGLCNPKTSGVIYECGGKMHLRESHWTEANTAFIEAFRNFDEAGARAECVSCLKYLVLANMLSGSNINPFDEPRAKAYSTAQEISSINSLVEAYQRKSLADFERILKTNKKTLLEDDVIQTYLPAVRKTLKKYIFLDLVKPYVNLSMSFVEDQLQLTKIDAEGLIVELILDGEVDATIDQINSVLYVKNSGGAAEANRKYVSCGRLVKNLSSLSHTILTKIN
uniref:PCI domain-containing protein n=1 Tax=Arcella intermedia TaxID=1963864 RepID=A0A6B2L452_9EUKA